ncbi:nrps-like enzyme protein [Rutstroemia sp. NJR-2017a BBW]|nr:nrps-like enzyme protein [Rutstroemia sp. NJR-2017a BBW]
MASPAKPSQLLDYGARLLHQTLDHLSVVSPSRLYASIPITSDLSQGFRDITFQDMVRCSDFVATLIETNIGRSTSFETVCFIGIPDLRSVAIFFGAVKCGYKVLFPSPRNPPTTNASLLEQTKCTTVFYAEEVGPIVKQLLNVRPELRCLTVPSFQTMLESHGEAFSYEKQTYQTAKNNPILVLHSSGSTGLPKPIVMTHGTFAVLDNERNLPEVSGRTKRDYSIWDFPGSGKFYHAFPYFHLAGFLSNVKASSPVLGPPLQPPGGSLLKEIMQHQKLRALYIPPAVAEQLLQEPQGIDFFKSLDFLVYTGAPFSPNAGKQLIEVTELVSLYGSTEAFQVPQVVPSKEDWAYMEWNPTFKLEMQPSEDEKGAYEMVLFTDSSTESMSALNHNMPGVTEWRTKDLFMPHPTKKNLWRYFGRRDDIIVLSNSEKFNPVPMELHVQGHPLLAGALVVGMGRVRASLLLEPKPHVQGDERKSLIETVWPRIEEANKLVPGHGRILQSNIIIADKPFLRAGKGTIVRKLTEQSFKEEIDALYSQTKLHVPAKLPTLRATFEHEAVLQFVRSIVVSCFPAAANASNSEDLFSHGLDSLKITELVAVLKAGIAEHSSSSDVSWITPEIIYLHPTINQLTIIVSDFLNSGKVPSGSNDVARISNMKNIVETYTRDLPKRSEHSATSLKDSSFCIAITGSTGTLGTYILSSIVMKESITRIYCLNRNPAAKQQQESLLISRGVPEHHLSKLHFMTVSIGEPQLGLSAEDYDRLLQDVDLMLHNAWKLDFNLSLPSYETPYLVSVRNMIELSAKSKKNTRICFVSSVSAVMESKSTIQETPALDFTAALKLGYAESKCVTEATLTAANQTSGIPVTILRVTQIGGSTVRTDPPWPTKEWLYPLLKASKSLNLIASNIAAIDWIPIDQAASVISDIISSTPKSNDLQVFNIVNPNPVPWQLLVEVQQQRFGPQAKVVPLQEWIRKMESDDAQKIAEPNLKAAVKLVSTLGDGRDEVKYATEQAVGISKTMASIKPIDKIILEMWFDQWGL